VADAADGACEHAAAAHDASPQARLAASGADRADRADRFDGVDRQHLCREALRLRATELFVSNAVAAEAVALDRGG